MLEKINLSDLPVQQRSNKNREFAKRKLENFLELNCDAVKVTGWPLPRTVSALRSAMKMAVKDSCATSKVKVLADKEHIYLMRVR